MPHREKRHTGGLRLEIAVKNKTVVLLVERDNLLSVAAQHLTRLSDGLD